MSRDSRLKPDRGETRLRLDAERESGGARRAIALNRLRPSISFSLFQRKYLRKLGWVRRRRA